MALEGLILRYYLKVFSVISLIFIFIFFVIAFYYEHELKYKIINIKKNSNIDIVIQNNFKNNNNIKLLFFKTYYRIYFLFNNGIHYGNFEIRNKVSINDFLNIVTKPSNILNKLTIIEGSNKLDLNKKIFELFNQSLFIDYTDILADTYYLNNYNVNDILINLRSFKKNFFINYKNNKLFNEFSINDLMIIGSLLEKEGLDKIDKQKIFSVIVNRLKKDMKLQIDATVIYALTNGKYNLDRKLRIKDLKFEHPYNTYIIKGLPPRPISYVGTKTIELMLENYKSNYLFYFYNENKKKHIFSETYAIHKKRLNEYRKKN